MNRFILIVALCVLCLCGTGPLVAGPDLSSHKDKIAEETLKELDRSVMGAFKYLRRQLLYTNPDSAYFDPDRVIEDHKRQALVIRRQTITRLIQERGLNKELEAIRAYIATLRDPLDILENSLRKMERRIKKGDASPEYEKKFHEMKAEYLKAHEMYLRGLWVNVQWVGDSLILHPQTPKKKKKDGNQYDSIQKVFQKALDSGMDLLPEEKGGGKKKAKPFWDGVRGELRAGLEATEKRWWKKLRSQLSNGEQ